MQPQPLAQDNAAGRAQLFDQHVVAMKARTAKFIFWKEGGGSVGDAWRSYSAIGIQGYASAELQAPHKRHLLLQACIQPLSMRKVLLHLSYMHAATWSRLTRVSRLNQAW